MIRTTVWQRLETVTRTVEYDRALLARVHDPLWLLARQWQFGELEGEDAGSPVHVRVETSSAPLARFRAAGATSAQPYDPDRTPLEVLAEAEPAGPPTLRVRADAGRRLVSLLRAHGAPIAAADVVRKFPLTAPAGTAETDPAAGIAGRLASVLHDRLPDGLAAADALRPSVRPVGSAAPALPASIAAPAAEKAAALAAAREFLDWVDAELVPPGRVPSWVRERLEYRFAVAARTAAGEVVLTAPEYRGAELDWHDLDVDGSSGATLGAAQSGASVAPASTVTEVFAAPVVFPGMPADRFWELEDATVSLPSVQAAPEDLGRLALVEFATAFGNDWYLVPVRIRRGTVTDVVSLVVTDTFGEALLVQPTDAAAAASLPAGSRWSMFALSSRDGSGGTGTPVARLVVLPVAAATTEREPIEDVLFARDEQANLVWAVERLVEGPDGQGRDRNDEWLPVAAALDPPPPPSPAPLAYRLMSAVPPHWIPFVAVHDSAENRGVRLERAAMLRLDADPPVPIPPVGRVLEPETAQFVVFEEEASREGVRIARIPALCRSVDGRTYLWMRRRRRIGRGEQSSGLAFDTARETTDGGTVPSG
jgi:hypothetical protein